MAPPTFRGARSILAWSCGLALVAWLVGRTGLAPILAALREGARPGFLCYTLLATALPLPLDAWATGRAISRLGIRVPERDLLLARGASYLAGMLNYALGQGSVSWFLVKRGVPAPRAGGAMLFVLATTGLATMAVTFVASVLGPSILRSGALRWLPSLTLLFVLSYLPGLAAARRLRFLRCHPLLEVLLEAPGRDHLLSAVARLPHLIAMSLLGWGLFRAWGLALPAAAGISATPVILLVASLPLTPAGLGTVPATQVALLSPFLANLPIEERGTEILACALTAQAVTLATQALIGVISLALLRLRNEPARST